MAGLLRSYVHHFHQRSGFVGPLWQGRFKSPAIERDGYLLSCGRYVERNPVEAGLVSKPWEYPWSSCRAYALGELDALLNSNPLYEELAATAERRRQLWREFLLGADEKEEAVRHGAWAIGGEAFRVRMRHQQGRPRPRRRGRPRKAPDGSARFLSQTAPASGDS
jgi:putative transposase